MKLFHSFMLVISSIAAASICHAEPSQFSLTMKTEGESVERKYWLYAPISLKSPSALVIVLHGYSSSAETIMAYSQMNEIADENGFLVAYPQGSLDSRNNPFFNVGYEFHSDNTTNDVAFIEGVVEQIQARYAVDPKQIFATGMSNGGDMSYLLACRSSDVFRAVAPIAGSMMIRTMQQCEANTATPILAISGTDDPVTLYAGDRENSGGWGSYAGQPETVKFWVDQMRLQKTGSQTLNNSHQPLFFADSTVICERHSSADNDVEMLFYRVDGGGHDWPGAKTADWWDLRRYAGLYGMGFGKNRDISASKEIWDFFAHWIERDNTPVTRRKVSATCPR